MNIKKDVEHLKNMIINAIIILLWTMVLMEFLNFEVFYCAIVCIAILVLICLLICLDIYLKDKKVITYLFLLLIGVVTLIIMLSIGF